MRGLVIQWCAVVFLLSTAGASVAMADNKKEKWWFAKKMVEYSPAALVLGVAGLTATAVKADSLDRTLSKEAMEKINSGRRSRRQSCEALSQEYQSLLPHAAYYAQRSARVYDHAEWMNEHGEPYVPREDYARLNINPNRLGIVRFPEGFASVYSNLNSPYYAEIWWNDGRKDAPIELIFRGTEIFKWDNWLTNLMQAYGNMAPHYEWAAMLLGSIRSDQGLPSDKERVVVVSGHSLGGGLAAYAVLRHPYRAMAITFNAAGLPAASISRAKDGVNAALASKNIHNFVSHFRGASQSEYMDSCVKHYGGFAHAPQSCSEIQYDHSDKEFLDPLSTLSFAQKWTRQNIGMSTHLIGKKYLVPLGSAGTLQMGKRHSIVALADQLNKYRSNPPPSPTLCHYNLGFVGY